MVQKQQPVISAASAVVWRDGKVLLVRRGRPPGKDFWSLPGGKVEPGETHEVAALREVLEETGIAAQILGFIGIFTVALVKVEYQINCFAALATSGEAGAGDDAAEARWVDILDLESMKLAPNTLDAIRRSQHFIKP